VRFIIQFRCIQQKAYFDSRYKEEDFPVTNQLVKEVISLPMHTELDDEQIKFITNSVLEFFLEINKYQPLGQLTFKNRKYESISNRRFRIYWFSHRS
jgi:hypothetical protein